MRHGWFVLNAREARWYHTEGRSAICKFEGEFEGEQDFLQLGINLSVLGPGEFMAMYHWEADQEDFVVLAGEALLIVEGEERTLRQWDFVHCPAGTNHVIVGAGDGPSVVLAVGARDQSTGPDWAPTPWTRPHSATAQASSRRRSTSTRRTRRSASVNQLGIARAGSPNRWMPTSRGARRTASRSTQWSGLAVRRKFPCIPESSVVGDPWRAIEGMRRGDR